MEDGNGTKKPNHGKKMVAPIIIASLLGAYYILLGAICLLIPEIPLPIKILMAVIPAALVGVIVYVLVERIHEIRSGEEDDLSKY